MSGTTIGGQKASETVKARFGENHYGIIGAIGGAKSRRTSAKERASRVMRHETKRKFEQGDSYYQSLLKKHGIVLD